MKKLKAGGGWPALFYAWKKARQAGGILKLWRAMRIEERLQDLRARHGRPARRHGQRARPLPRSLQEESAGDGRRHAGRHPQRLLATVFRHATCNNFRRASSKHCGRLVEPVRYTRETGRYTPITWKDALESIATKLRATPPDETFWYFSGRSSNEAGFLLQLFARLYGTNNVNNCSFYCHQASGVGLASVTGSGTATIELEDLEHADCVFVIGGNPASNHPRLMRTLLHVRRRGGQVIAINPIVETGLVRFNVPSDIRSLLFGSRIATLYVQPHIGGDLAMLTGIAKRIVEMGAHDEAFLNNHCQGWPELNARLASISWDEIIDEERSVARRNR